MMYERLFEEHVKGTVSDEWFMQLSVKYESERDELKVKIRQYKEELTRLESFRQGKEQFQNAFRSFMEMKRLTPALLNELIDKIVVYNIEGKGKNKTQKIIIHYKFIGAITLPASDEFKNIVLEPREGVAVTYLTDIAESKTTKAS